MLQIARGVQKIIDDIGGLFNLSLMKIGLYRRCIFIEGQDDYILKHFYDIIFPNNINSLIDYPIIKLGGFSQINKAISVAELFNTQAEGNIKCFCLLDRDYYHENKYAEYQEKAKEVGMNLHIWNRKEIENYLLDPKIVFKVTKLEQKHFDDFLKKYVELLDAEKESVITNISDKIFENQKGLTPSTCYKRAKAYVDEKWTTVDFKIELVSGKEIISKINDFIKKEYGQHCSIKRLLDELDVEDIADEVVDVITNFFS